MAESEKQTSKPLDPLAVVITPAAPEVDEIQNGGAVADIVGTPSEHNYAQLENELLGSEEQISDPGGVMQTFKRVEIMAAIRRHGDDEHDMSDHSDSESPNTDSDSENEPSILLGEELSNLEMGTRQISEKSDILTEMPTIGIQQRYTLQRNDSLANVYFSALLASGHEVRDYAQYGRPQFLVTEDSDDASLEDTESVPEWISSLPAEQRTSIIKFAADMRRSRAQTTEELQQHYKLTEEQAEEVVDLADKLSVVEALSEGKKVGEPEDLICGIEYDMWKPVDSSFDYPVSKKQNKLLNLKISGEFFRFVRRGFTEKKMLVETELPDLKAWNEKTYKMFAFKGRNRVTNITEALASALRSTEILRDFLEYSCIILEEPVGSESKFVQYGDPRFGSRTFMLGKHSILNARCLFNFTSQKFTFRDEIWDEVLETQHPGRDLMMEPVFVAQGVESKTASDTRRFDSLQRLHNLFVSDYLKSIQAVGFTHLRSKGRRHPLLFTFDDLYKGVDVNRKMEKPLKDVFGNVCYCVNPDPDQHIPDMLNKYKTLKRCRMMCDTVGWLHTLLYLLDQRICEVFRLDAAIRNWLAKKKPKTQNSKKKSKVRLAVEDLLRSINKERAQLNEMINLVPKAKQFEELYLEEKKNQKEEMRRMAENSTNASKRLSRGKMGTKSAPPLSPNRKTSPSPSPDPPFHALRGPPPGESGARSSKLDKAIFDKRRVETITRTGKKKSKGFRLGARSPRKHQDLAE